MSRKSLRTAETSRLTLNLIRAQAIPLLSIFLFSVLAMIVVEDRMLNLAQSEESERWILQLGLGLVDLTVGSALVLVLAWGLPKVFRFNETHYMRHPFSESYLESFFAEYFRMMANVLLWGLALIIPGFVRYCRLIFVPLVTLFVKPYRDGKVDALKLAEQLTHGRMFNLSLALVVTTIIQIGLEFTPQIWATMHTIPFRIIFSGLGFYLSVWFFAFLFLQFDEAMSEHDWSKS